MKYAWGSAAALPEWLGVPNPGAEPWAELWIGAHPRASSSIQTADGESSLVTWIGSDPRRALGEAVAERFDGRLPFLLKVLAVEAPLSLQLHPAGPQAARGYADEERRGVPLASPDRIFADPWAKPELIVAVSPFAALCGLLDDETVATLWEPLPCSLPPALACAASAAERLRALFELRSEDRNRVASELIRGCDNLASRGQAYADVSMLARRYPADPGCAAPLLLQRHALKPGEALFLEPGQIHCYLSGSGVELMASSDNVLRAGLTQKPIRPDLVLELLDVSSRKQETIRPVRVADGRFAYPASCEEFQLERITLDGTSGTSLPTTGGPELLLVYEGTVSLPNAPGDIALQRGQAAFLTAERPEAVLGGSGVAFWARVGTHTEVPDNR
ncbi:MAG: mannose-6-phosphate isomerase, class I [Myxococcales bacterium]|nr:mannose-6-phosphate isomerase, class I [Myxococcales bacterium]